VLAIDPTSLFSGGALLGDRIRMQGHATDPGVFIRSMGSRGQLGGLAAATPQAIRVLAAAAELAARVADGRCGPHEAAEELLLSAGIFNP
jgi:hypothetical protein